MWINTAFIEFSLEVTQKLQNRTPTWPSYVTSGHIPTELHIPPPSYLYPRFYRVAVFGIQQGYGAHLVVCQQMNGYWKPGKQYKMDYYSALKKNEITKLSRKWVLRMYKIKQSYQCQKEKSCKVSLICGALPLMYACMHAKPKRCMYGCSITCSREDREEHCRGWGGDEECTGHTWVLKDGTKLFLF